ncbi:hypothetical protein PZH41_24700, partial [Phocaeicola vulgatus]|nr:hypothetical protein [Phocaeicola vulgatus]
KVWLNAGTLLIYPSSFISESRNVYIAGEGFFEVSKDIYGDIYPITFLGKLLGCIICLVGVAMVASLSQEGADACLEALQTADRLGLTISCDLNFRKKLWN